MADMTLSEELQWRGFVNQTTLKDITVLNGEAITFYWGVDPSAPSMTIGNLAAAMMVCHFIDHGHKAVLLIGGATGMIGDPDGKAEERTLKTVEEVETNKKGIQGEYKRIFGDRPFEVVDNYDWFKDFKYLEFLRDVGKHVPMRQMLQRDFVQSRLSEEGAGISYAEFSYVLIQGYDFLHLSRTKGVSLQVCGSDQWGNSIAGVELIRRIGGKEAHVWSTPLVINKATGKKFGKSEDGAVWLDENLTSVYKFYQFWLNVDDEGVIDYMKIYTLLSRQEIERIQGEFEQDKAGRLAQKTLAYEVTKLVHGVDRADSVKRISEVLFGGRSYSELTEADFEQLKSELPYAEGPMGSIIDIIAGSELASSKTEARRFLEGGAIYINGKQVEGGKSALTEQDTIKGYVLLRRGKNAQVLYRLA
jgi:tyrosyl-tRNA synthetase